MTPNEAYSIPVNNPTTVFIQYILVKTMWFSQCRLISKLVLLNSVVVKNVHEFWLICYVWIVFSYILRLGWTIPPRWSSENCEKRNDDNETVIMMVINEWEPKVHTKYCLLLKDH